MGTNYRQPPGYSCGSFPSQPSTCVSNLDCSGAYFRLGQYEDYIGRDFWVAHHAVGNCKAVVRPRHNAEEGACESE